MNEINRTMKDHTNEKSSNGCTTGGHIPIPSGNSIRYATYSLCQVQNIYLINTTNNLKFIKIFSGRLRSSDLERGQKPSARCTVSCRNKVSHMTMIQLPVCRNSESKLFIAFSQWVNEAFLRYHSSASRRNEFFAFGYRLNSTNNFEINLKKS